MKTVLLGMLIVLMSCSTIRVVCVTSHASPDASATSEEEICARVCVKRPTPPPPPPAAPQMTCLITVDPSCALLTLTVYVLPTAPELHAPTVVARLGARAAAPLTSIDRVLHAPPPKALL